MKCQSCDVDIPPAWVKVIDRNICPNCDGPIMSEDYVQLIQGLADALSKMPNDPKGLAGWLVSNYRMEKVGDGEPTGFYNGLKRKEIEQEVVREETKQQKVLDFFKRAEASNVGVKKDDLIKKNNNMASVPISESDEGIIDVPSEYLDPAYADVDVGEYMADAGLQTPLAGGVDLEVDAAASPALRQLLQIQSIKQRQASHKIAEGVKTNKNGFSRG